MRTPRRISTTGPQFKILDYTVQTTYTWSTIKYGLSSNRVAIEAPLSKTALQVQHIVVASLQCTVRRQAKK